MSRNSAELIRYLINGLIATGIHYIILTFNIEVIKLSSAAIANMIAAVFGVTVSFLGSRYFVFRKIDNSFSQQAIKFGFLYGIIAVLHGMVLLVWTDWFGLNYSFGFLIATTIQVSVSYLGNKFLVFKE
ncbi:GtrA family protein [Yersinia alsatica]|uniref:GtrA family protein n=1 Tax=Yersinia alsatica TaxID=2890317 RepID=UPI0011A5C405|nr:GtrA family protein [Yersinia alsatica]